MLRELILIIILLIVIAIFIAMKKTSEKRERNRLEKERKKKEMKRKDGLKSLSEEERNLLLTTMRKERTSFIENAEGEYETAFHPFPTFEHTSVDKTSDMLVEKSIGYYVIPKGYDRIAAFFFIGEPSFEPINAITLNINGMVNRRFEGYQEYMRPRYFNVKSGDIITIEIEFEEKENLVLKDFGVLLLKTK